MKRDFHYKELDFHLNDNHGNREFEEKYDLLFWHQGYERWQKCANVNSKKEALEYVKSNYSYL